MSNTVLINDVEYMPVASVNNDGSIVEESSGEPAVLVVLGEGGVAGAVKGILKKHRVTLAAANPSTAAAGYITGSFKAVWATKSGVEFTAGEEVILGYSTNINDETALGFLLTADVAAEGTPAGSGVPNLLSYTPKDIELQKALYDGETPIKTIMLRYVSGATTPTWTIWTVE